ncbi:hypothetical protein DEU56DRAFT_909679 [Suillus clintonianus]|uniref:uncharacterized protein n=1 Tax=Suillus clintonianus TaxID=1904413 RepID=UPI001B864986|nr:uncharacterized protein DEU56DRAFT_909679 [Suillus clintonianus]KAG2146620.1 hypothetical protein DEU56DRAFT_909679 [Suillus clintonianus]
MSSGISSILAQDRLRRSVAVISGEQSVVASAATDTGGKLVDDEGGVLVLPFHLPRDNNGQKIPWGLFLCFRRPVMGFTLVAEDVDVVTVHSHSAPAPAPAPPLFRSPLSLQLSAPAPVFALPSALAPALTPTPAPVVVFAISLPSASPSIPQNSSF